MWMAEDPKLEGPERSAPEPADRWLGPVGTPEPVPSPPAPSARGTAVHPAPGPGLGQAPPCISGGIFKLGAGCSLEPAVGTGSPDFPGKCGHLRQSPGPAREALGPPPSPPLPPAPAGHPGLCVCLCVPAPAPRPGRKAGEDSRSVRSGPRRRALRPAPGGQTGRSEQGPVSDSRSIFPLRSRVSKD